MHAIYYAHYLVRTRPHTELMAGKEMQGTMES